MHEGITEGRKLRARRDVGHPLIDEWIENYVKDKAETGWISYKGLEK